MKAFPTVFLLLALPLSGHAEAPSSQAVEATLRTAQDHILAHRIEGRYWNMPAYLGPHYVSQFWLLSRWLGRTPEGFDHDRFRRMLLEERREDGSWQAVTDPGVPTGNLEATLLNYAYLKATHVTDEVLKPSREWIRAAGGIAAAPILVRVILSMFGNHPWSRIPRIPLLIFQDWFPVNHSSFAQWITPHLMPIAWLKRHAVVRDPGPEFHLDELWLVPPSRGLIDWIRDQLPELGLLERSFFAKITAAQQPKGTWGGYTVSTMLILATLAGKTQLEGEPNPTFTRIADQAYERVRELYLDSGPSAYLGVTMDGRYWDTALCTLALLEAGTPAADLASAGTFLEEAISEETGGIAFGEDFWYAPDTDDTAEALMVFTALARAGVAGADRFEQRAETATRWLLSMQNKDGGWGAFDQENTGNMALEVLAGCFLDSADLFDDSCEDVTGHILEALAGRGLTRDTSEVVARAVDFLFDRQQPGGSWFGRWGINHIYGTGAAVVGLVAAGVEPEDRRLVRALDWVASVQNPDGGFGESSHSYEDPEHIGRGPSTPSQTAWALLALVAGGRAQSVAAHRAAQYLIASQDPDRGWTDPYAVGTGHPNVCYMEYPSYPRAFPLIALARYAHAQR